MTAARTEFERRPPSDAAFFDSLPPGAKMVFVLRRDAPPEMIFSERGERAVEAVGRKAGLGKDQVLAHLLADFRLRMFDGRRAEAELIDRSAWPAAWRGFLGLLWPDGACALIEAETPPPDATIH